MIDFKNVKIIEKLGAGMMGTIYLVKYNNKKYAMKIEHITEDNKNIILNGGLYRELDVYEYINKMKRCDQSFFIKLHGYEIYDNCKHIQIRPNKTNKILLNYLKPLDESPFCLKTLIDYKGKYTLKDFLISNTITVKETYSFILQICKIILLLYDGGYSHNDLHDKNVMVTKTKKKYFLLEGEQIPYCGYQLCAIDYGSMLHKKFGKTYIDISKNFLLDRKLWLYKEVMYYTNYIYYNIINLRNSCNRQTILFQQILYFEKEPILYYNDNIYIIFNKIVLNNHTDFFIKTSNKYIKLYPHLSKIFKYIIDNRKTIDNIYKFINENPIIKNNKSDLHIVYNKIINEFRLKYPKLYIKYLNLCEYYDYLIPHNDVFKILETNNLNDLLKVYIKLSKDVN
jgi:serine/threonine protein kinase